MPSFPKVFPSIPEDSARAAGALFGKGNISAGVEEQIDELYSGLISPQPELHAERIGEMYFINAMMTVFQYAEGLTDIQTVEELPNRVDMNYALHLPLCYPCIPAQALCEFRQGLTMEGERQESFPRLLDRLTEFGLMKMQDGEASGTLQVIEVICSDNRMERVFEAMYKVLETLALISPDWLRQLTLPHWYQRYSRKTTKQLRTDPKEGWKAMLVQTAIDIEYLLGVIDRSDQAEIKLLEEVQELRKVLNEQFEMSFNEQTYTREVQWRQAPHPSCCWS